MSLREKISSQGSLKVYIFDRLNTFLQDIDLEPYSFPHLIWQTYKDKTETLQRNADLHHFEKL